MKPLHTRSAVSRADLLRVYAEHGGPALEQAAVLLGYERRVAPKTVVCPVDGIASPIDFGLADVGPPPLPQRPAVLPTARFFQVSEHRQRDAAPAEVADDAPSWVSDGPALTEDSRPTPGSVRLPAPLPLTRWSRLWPFLRRALGQTVDSRQPDLPRLVDRLTRGEALLGIPMRRRQGWSPRIAILADYSRSTQAFHGDFNRLCRALEKRHGSLGLERRVLAGEPGRQPLVRRPLHSAAQRWQVPPAATPLLILSDLGLLDGTPETLLGWRKFAGRLRGAACPALVLCPVPAALHPASLPRDFAIVEWDRHSRLHRAADAPPAQAATERRAAAVERLLTLLAPALSVEPALLRAIRYLQPAAEADVLAEAMLWQHPDVLAGAQGLQFASQAAVARYQNAFAALAPDLKRTVVDRILAHHAGLPESVRRREIIACRRLAPEAVPPEVWQDTVDWLYAFARTALRQPEAFALQQCVRRHVDRQSDEALAADDVQAALWAIAQRERVARGEVVELPAGVRPEQVRFFLGPESDHQRTACALRQRGLDLSLEPLDIQLAGGTPDGSHYADLTLVGGGVFVRVTRWEAAPVHSYVAAVALPQTVVRLTREVERVELRAPPLELTVVGLERPPWARALGRDARGLFAEVLWLGRRCRVDWRPPQAGEAGRWHSEQSLGVDAYGLFGEITVGGVGQRFRWIAPGRFRMGSPPDEPERDDDEVQHEVTLSRGFWLADTACTQAFWQAVTGSNPSRFKDDPRNPVENVSWNDVQTFIAELGRRVPGLPVRLPTEAEWEYACRAGTTTPFSFGDNINPDLVNYNGNSPYANGKKGLYREKTVPVASLPANPWGLYEMHGNVWEWCADWFGDYPSEPQVDPQGPPTGDNRVLRGGSWFNNGGFVRSAHRDRIEPGDRDVHIGFRLALGPGGQVGSPAEPVTGKGLAAEPTTQRSRRAEPASTAPPAGAAGAEGKTTSLLGRFTDFLKRKK